ARLRRGDEIPPAVRVLIEVHPERRRVDDDAGQRRTAAVREQHRILAQPDAGTVGLVEDPRLPLVSGEQPLGTLRPRVERPGGTTPGEDGESHQRRPRHRLPFYSALTTTASPGQ